MFTPCCTFARFAFFSLLIPAGLTPRFTGVGLLAVLPIGLIVRDTRALSKMSSYSCAIILAFAFSLFFLSVYPVLDSSLLDVGQALKPKAMEVVRPEGIWVAFPIMVFAFAPHAVVFPVYGTLRGGSGRTM